MLINLISHNLWTTGLSTVFNCWNFCFIIITQWWAMVDFITQNGPIFHKIHPVFKIFVVINQKLWDVCGQKLVLVVSTIGTTNTPSFVKIQEVTQNSLLIWHGMTPIDCKTKFFLILVMLYKVMLYSGVALVE